MLEQRVIFCDVDDVLTFDSIINGKKTRIIDRNAIARIKKLVGKGYKVAFITGKAADFVQRDFIPVLKEFGIDKKCLIYGEHGFYEIRENQVIMVSEAIQFLKERNELLNEINHLANKNGIVFAPYAEETKQVTLYFKLSEPTPQNQQKLAETIQQAITNLKKSGKLDQGVKFNLTKSGCDVYPASTSKGNAVVDALSKWRLPLGKYRGRAYGDMAIDRKMAYGPKIRFYLISGKSKHFLEETRFLGLKFLGRKIRGCIAVRERRMPKPVRKLMKIARKQLPV